MSEEPKEQWDQLAFDEGLDRYLASLPADSPENLKEIAWRQKKAERIAKKIIRHRRLGRKTIKLHSIPNPGSRDVYSQMDKHLEPKGIEVEVYEVPKRDMDGVEYEQHIIRVRRDKHGEVPMSGDMENLVRYGPGRKVHPPDSDA